MSSSVKGFAHLQIPLAEILEATNNFAPENIVDSDEFDRIYKGQLVRRGELITARKVQYREAEFWKEIRVLSSLKHENIVSNIGYCKEKGEHIIINKHEVNGSLYEHLRHKTMITWIQRLKISVGIARGLSYIHYDEGHNLSIIHGNIKSSTILLDKNWVPKLSGFGLSMINPVDERHSAHNSEIYATPGYTDPVCIETGTVSHKSDVYSLGIVLFEILCGRLYWDPQQSEYLDEMAKYHYKNGKLDDLIGPDLQAQMDKQSFNLFSKTAYSCLNEDPSQRPNAHRIVRVLEKALELQQKHENSLILKVPSAVEVEDTSYRSSEGGNLEHIKIPLSDILSATEDFDEKYEIASGGFGTVYKAKLDHYDRNNLRFTDGKDKSELQKKCSTVAIKRITAREDKLGEQGFDVEIKMLFNCDHPNIVSLLGFCDDGQELILVYELASNKSLEDFLINSDDILNFSLNWEQRLKICIGIACGLNYLHEQGIVHRDIKSANILLNENWDAKIADFGLSTSHPTNQQANTIPTKKFAGTPFYMDPEYEKTGILRKASDIYSFGVVLFEIMSGRLAYHQSYIKENRKGVAAIARQCCREETILQKLVDPVLKEEYLSQDSLDTFSKIAYKCLEKSQANRPKAKDIIEELRKALSFQELEEDKEDILRIPLDNILLATKNFSMLIRSEYFWEVYKGEVTHANEHNTIAAKRIIRKRSTGGADRYAAECKVLSKYKHENVIGLVGYCAEGDEMVIVYEYASNSSLDCHLSSSDLTWMKRLNICIDVARGIDFLHEGLGTSEFVIHGNIEIGNILLDGDWKAKLSDFGISLTIPINHQMDYVTDDAAGTIGYVDPLYVSTRFLTKESDIFSLGVVLLEVLCGRFSIEYDERERWSRIMLAKQHFKKGTLEEIVLNCIKEQIVPRSLAIYSSITFQCLHSKREMRPTASEVIVQLTKALEFQVDHETWEPKLPKDYQNIIQLSMSPESYSTMKKEDLYNIFSNGILLQHEKVISFRGNGERNEMISARNFSYVHSCPHKWRSLPESRFEKVPEMLDVSNLMIEIITRPQFLTPDTVYGVHLVFKFCESSTFSASPTYVNLKYRNGSETLHAYFATRRDNGWMMIELCRFLYHIEDDISFKFLLESFSPCYCRDGAIYVEGIEFRAIDKVKHKNIEKPEQVQQLATNYEEILNGYINYEDGEKLFWASEVNEKKQLTLSAKAVLYDFSNVKLFTSKASADSRFLEVIELLPQQIFYINCRIESQMLSQDTEYVCHLVFKISEESHGLHCPLKVRDLLHPENKEPEFIYFTSPRPWNLHDITRVPGQREDGWMEVNVGRFNSARDLKSDCVLVNLKFTSYEGSMSGLILCGLEFRPL